MSHVGPIPFVLLVEDNHGDLVLIKEALNEGETEKTVAAVHDGQEAMEWLQGRVEQKLPLPHIIFIDINLPRMNGHELLQWIKTQETLRPIPILVLTTSASDQDIRKAYESGAASFLTKPIDLDDFTALFETIETYWFSKVSLPPKS